MLVVYAHPVPDSFNAAVHARLLSGLREAGHEVRDLDLYRLGFVPAMSEAERRDYMTRGTNAVPVAEHLEHLRWAEGLILVYPTWWYSLPAMLKGWLDRVWVPGVAFEVGGRVGLKPLLSRVRRIGVVTTYGSPWWILLLVGWPDWRLVRWGLRTLCARGCRLDWYALYGMDTCSASRRERFLAHVAGRLAGWR